MSVPSTLTTQLIPPRPACLFKIDVTVEDVKTTGEEGTEQTREGLSAGDEKEVVAGIEVLVVVAIDVVVTIN